MSVSLINGHIDDEMTDEQIIKALECCTDDEKGITLCAECPYHIIADEDYCVEDLLKQSLDLINRQKAELEGLKELVDEMGDYFPACINCEGKTTIGERTDACVYSIDTTNYCTKRGLHNILAIQNENRELKAEIKTAKAEAVKELAERIKENTFTYLGEIRTYDAVMVKWIDKCVKEMVGAESG